MQLIKLTSFQKIKYHIATPGKFGPQSQEKEYAAFLKT